MEIQRSSPPAYLAHNPADLNLPSVPRTALSRPKVQGEITLPDLKTVLSPEFEEATRLHGIHAPDTPGSTRSLPRMNPGNASRNEFRSSAEAPVVSPSEAGSAMSVDDRDVRSTSSVSIDDPDVRIAAEALSGLGNPGKTGLHRSFLILLTSLDRFRTVAHIKAHFTCQSEPSTCQPSRVRTII